MDEFEIPEPVHCPMCHGSGQVPGDPYAFFADRGDHKNWRYHHLVDFLAPYYGSRDAADSTIMGTRFTGSVHILNQLHRVLSKADLLAKVDFRVGDFLILILCVAAESMSKLYYGFNGDGKSKHYVRRFFFEMSPPEWQNVFTQVFQRRTKPQVVTDLDAAVELFYHLRCAVAHEGAFRAFLWWGDWEEDYRLLKECIIRTTMYALTLPPR